jgi:hypothetical protein
VPLNPEGCYCNSAHAKLSQPIANMRVGRYSFRRSMPVPICKYHLYKEVLVQVCIVAMLHPCTCMYVCLERENASSPRPDQAHHFSEGVEKKLLRGERSSASNEHALPYFSFFPLGGLCTFFWFFTRVDIRSRACKVTQHSVFASPNGENLP